LRGLARRGHTYFLDKIITNNTVKEIMAKTSKAPNIIMKYVHHTIRIFTGVFLLAVFGSKFGFLPSAVTMERMFTPEGWAFISAIQASGYLFPAVGIVSLLCGLAFLANRYVFLAAILLLPITVNFALFHIFLGFPIPSLFSFLFFRETLSYVPLALNLYMLYSEREKFTALLK